MQSNPLGRFFNKLFSLVLIATFVVIGSSLVRIAAAKDYSSADRPVSATLPVEAGSAAYKWNVNERELPLLGLAQENLKVGFDQSLSYTANQFDFLMFKALTFHEEHGTYLLPILSKATRSQSFLEFTRGGAANLFLSPEGIELQDQGTTKVVKTVNGTKYLFILYPDNEFRCAMIKEANGGTLNLLYTANGLVLHGVVDSTGRTVTFNYGAQGIQSVTQTWMADSRGFTRTWNVGEERPGDVSTKYAHAIITKTGKFLPSNAVIEAYTETMAASDKLLAQIFGGPNAVAGGNGFEPAGLAASYPFYRGDIIGDDGKVRRGHLSYAMHIYGSPDGKGESALYVPAGFASHGEEPSPTDAAVTFYYPRLGNLTDVTLAVFHVADFRITPEGDRIRIGNLGGVGGSSALYKHSHIEFYRGNVGLPSGAARPALRIDPATVFAAR